MRHLDMLGQESVAQRKFCPQIMCPDGQAQDQHTCQCRPVAQTLSAVMVKDLTRFGDLIHELCSTVRPLMRDDVCDRSMFYRTKPF